MRRTRSPKPGTPAWIEERKRAIFATDAAATANMSRWSDPHRIYLDKLGLTAPSIELERFKWGKLLEPVIAHEWARTNGVKVVPQQHWTFWRDDVGFPMACHLDFSVGPTYDEILEIKTASSFSAEEFGDEGTDQIPPDYLLQVTHEMAVVNAKRCHVVALVGGNRLRSFVVERDLDLEARLIAREAEAWQGVVDQEPPAIDGSNGSSEFLKITQAQDDGSEIALDEDTAELALSYLAAKEQEKAALQQQAEIGNRIRERLGRASIAKADDITVTYRQNKPTVGFDWPVIARDLAEEVARHRPDATVLSVLAERQVAHQIEKPGARPLLVKYRSA